MVAWLLDHSNLDVPDIDSVPAAPSLPPPPPVVPVQVEEGRNDEYEGDGEGEDDDDSSSDDSDGYELNVDTAAVTGTTVHVQETHEDWCCSLYCTISTCVRK